VSTNSGKPQVNVPFPPLSLTATVPSEVEPAKQPPVQYPAAVTADVHIFTRSKLPWLAWPMGARAFEAFYKIDQVCPPESLARWRELAAISS
jgi:hypothetical protein